MSDSAADVRRSNAFGDTWLEAINGDAFVERSAFDTFDRHYSLDFTRSDRLYVFIGSDSGLLLEYLAARTLGRSVRCVVVELDTWYRPIAARSTAFREHDQIRLVSADAWDSAIDHETFVGYLFGGSIEVVDSYAALRGGHAAYDALREQLRVDIGNRSHAIRSGTQSRTFALRHLQNAPDLRTSSAALAGRGAGKTAVVLAGGPSLDDLLPDLLAERERFTVFAVSRLAAKLQSLGVKPDVVVTVDPQDGMYDVSKEGLLWDDVLLLVSHHAVPALVSQWRGPVAHFGPCLPWPTELDEAGVSRLQGPTVGHASVLAAIDIGFSKVLLAGLDLCFSRTGATHASGTLEQALGALALDTDIVVETYAGTEAGTNRPLGTARESLAQLGREAKRLGVRVINLNPYAARVADVEHVPLADIEFAGGARADLGLAAASEPIERLNRVRLEFDRARHAITRLRRRCREASDLVDRFHGMRGRQADRRAKARLDALEAKLPNDIGPVYDFVRLQAQNHLDALATPTAFDDMEEAEFAAWGRRYYRTLSRTAKALDRAIEAAIERTDHRLAEHGAHIDPIALIDYWRIDRTPGRCWHLSRSADASLAPDVRTVFDEACREFDATLTASDTAFERAIVARNQDSQRLIQGVDFLFENRRREELATFRDRLASESDSSRLVGLYAAALYAELVDDVDGAYAAHRTVVDEIGVALEAGAALDAAHARVLNATLRRLAVLQIRLEDHTGAIETLGLLTQQAIEHAPLYARALELGGFPEQAIEVLDIYLDAQPNDWITLDEMARLRRLTGDTEAADVALARADALRPVRTERRAAA